ncbi:MAG TPA: AMP-binding protein, partial [Burkholderiales bacterium]
MQGLMMDMPLLISELIRHADRHHGSTEIVSRTVEGPIHRYTYREAHARARRLANALQRLGVAMHDRVATLAWNGYRHFEIYYAAAGSGAVIHTINPRLFPDQIAYIANHAEDMLVFFDLTFAPLLEKLAPQLKSVRHFVAMTDRAHMPKERIPGVLCYEDIVEAEAADFEWPSFDERTAACLCYTSGTTGNPKGALYSHRSSILHAYGAALPDSF